MEMKRAAGPVLTGNHGRMAFLDRFADIRMLVSGASPLIVDGECEQH
jgi:hypothetical protein